MSVFTSSPWLWALTPLLLMPLVWIFGGRLQRRPLRSVLTLIAAACLLLMGLQPEISSRDEQKTVLLTSGWTGSKKDSMANGLILAMPDAEKPLPSKTRIIPDTAWAQRNMPWISELHVLGHGLEGHQWNTVPATEIFTYTPPLPTGVVHLQWPEQVHLGGDVVIQGVLSNPNGATLEIVDPGGNRTLLNTDEQSRFRFVDRPRSTGIYTWTLEVKEAGYRLPLHIEVLSRSGLNVLFLEASPNFETRHLEDWLIRAGGGYLTRTRISKDNFRWEQKHNKAFDMLNRKVLNQFHLVVTDPRALAALSEPEIQALEAEMEESGLGLYLRAEPESESHPLSERFTITAAENPELRPVTPDTQPATAINALPYILEHRPGQEPLALDRSGQILAAATSVGRGKIATALTIDTWQWILEGNTAVYEAWWQNLFTALARPGRSNPLPALFSPQPYRVDVPMKPGCWSDGPKPQLTLTEPSKPVVLPLRQNPEHLQQYQAVYRPGEEGRHNLGGLSFHVYGNTGWEAMDAARRQRDTANAIPNRTLQAGSAPKRNIPYTWLLTPFLAAMTGLWLERKK